MPDGPKTRNRRPRAASVTGDRSHLVGPEDPVMPAVTGRAGTPTWRPHRWSPRDGKTHGCCTCGWGNPPRGTWPHIKTWQRVHVTAEARRHGITVAELHARSKLPPPRA
jgi:hypothetical protein